MIIHTPIDIISKANMLLDFMDEYNLTGLIQATDEQIAEYIINHNLQMDGKTE